ncbi:hypothetical protein [Andreprevotia chitinilytica]|uniref:hypothetical protein n=1 Tax=Andreprevotia chitinilytica TaxID=396808 RepID=UPI00068EEAC0|nr:hypothetical protein [Andreprevotia chitinilytica]
MPIALFVLLETWLWLHLRPLVAGFLELRIWRVWGAALTGWLVRRSPWQAFACFALPMLALLPAKFLDLWLLKGGHVLWAVALLIALKLFSFGVLAFIERACRPALRRLPLYRHIYAFVQRLRRWAKRQTRPWRLWFRHMRERLRSDQEAD